MSPIEQTGVFCNQTGTPGNSLNEGIIMDMIQTNTKKTRSLTDLAKQLNGLNIKHAESLTLQHFSLTVPFLIMLESCNESNAFLQFYEITYNHHSAVLLSEDERKLTLTRAQHKHAFVEMMFVLSGEVTMQIEHQMVTYTEGQCCIMNRNIHHHELPQGNFSVVFFMFQNEFLESIMNNYQAELHMFSDPHASFKTNEIFRLIHDNQADTRLFDKVYLNYRPAASSQAALEKMIPLFNEIIFEIMGKEAGYSLYIKGAFLRFFRLLTSPELYSEEKSLAKAVQHDQVFADIAHMMEEQHGRCTREELSRKLHYTGEYINRIVKMYIGKTLSEYAQTILLEDAKKLLLHTDMNISDIIYSLGISNRSYFYRLFEKAYGMTPLEYRRQHSRLL